MMDNVLKPIQEPFPEKIAAALAAYPKIEGRLLSLFLTFANSRRFLEKGVPNLLDKGSPLPLRIREIVILRVTANRRCEYEWGVHAAIFAGPAKLTPEQVAATAADDFETATWPAKEARLLIAIDALCRTGTLSDDLLRSFQEDWDPEQQLEILALCGAYTTVSLVANVARLAAEPFAARFPNAD